MNIAIDHKLLDKNGYIVVPCVFSEVEVDDIRLRLDNSLNGPSSGKGEGKPYGVRNLLNRFPYSRGIANDNRILALIQPGDTYRQKLVSGIFFDKHSDANWKVAWHQDLTITIRNRVEVDGYGPWSVKSGIAHVQPRSSVLEKMIAVRIHLDDTTEFNGALRVLPGSHKHGRLDAKAARALRQKVKPLTCAVPKGGVMLMKPLLLHTSSPAISPLHRRVLHFEYAWEELHGGLEWFES